ncbi:hypothetical protein [Streptomyces beijiangensis]|uniref:Uncharacterized protein n=1 Tax=Streptomyces beijiangensis TaxID=163361 RepID=A0A939F2F4_9ACTN|nr:hypothetical protein [Streptomyces beijiangensis]MBO0510534.1 hypothetical protein [Streptomyces beijiangensis]
MPLSENRLEGAVLIARNVREKAVGDGAGGGGQEAVQYFLLGGRGKPKHGEEAVADHRVVRVVGGRQYFTVGSLEDDRTYRLKTNEDNPAASGYDDLATLVRTVNGVQLAGGDDRFASDAFRDAAEQVLNVPAFLRWAGAKVLLGSWDNYFATRGPAQSSVWCQGGVVNVPPSYIGSLIRPP